MLAQEIKMAWKAVASNKMRSFLTMLGIIIGIVALVVMVSLVSGATDSVTSEIASMGNDMLSVTVIDDRGNPLSLEDVKAIGEDPAIGMVGVRNSVNLTAKYAYTSLNTTVYGATAAIERIEGLELEEGRFLKTTDVNNTAFVAVLSNKAAIELFGRSDVVGESFLLEGHSFLVVGILVEDTSMMASMAGTPAVYVPFSAYTKLSGQGHVTTFYATASDTQDTAQAEATLTKRMNQRFKQDEDAYRLINQSTIMDTMSQITGTLSLLLGGIAAISLLVGGIGIMNIMLVSVTERTKEIGIRKAIGAGRSSILMQFLVEALMLSLIGCVAGLGLSYLILQIITLIAGDLMTFTMSGSIIALAVGFASFIGIVFGLYPANKASIMHPIQALRYEG